jgi:methionyl-tRNA formyltransferase
LRVVAFVNNVVGRECLEAIQQHGDTVAAVVVHPRTSSSQRDEILALAAKQDSAIIESTDLENGETIKQLAELNPNVGVSAYFGYILRPETIRIFPQGIVNVHPAYLPYNRGSYPNVWAIIDSSPAGATIHYIDEGVDTGGIISQTELDILPEDTGESLYRRLETACIELFTSEWPNIVRAKGRLPVVEQESSDGSSHRMRDTNLIDQIDLDANYNARELLNLIRARTFSGYDGAYFKQDGSKYFIRIEIEKESSEDLTQ